MTLRGLDFLRVLFLVGSIGLLPISLHAQINAQPLSTSKQLSFLEWVQTVESTTDYKIYFNKSEIDTLQVEVDPAQASLPSILEELFKNTEFNYSIDRHKNVFITYGWVINTDLPSIQFVDSSIKNDALDDKEKITDYLPDSESVNAEKEVVHEIGVKSNKRNLNKVILSGRVTDKTTGEPFPGANVFIKTPMIGVSTDQFGYYSISLPTGHHTLFISSVGMNTGEYKIHLYSKGEFNVELQESVQSLKEIVVSGEQDFNTIRTEMGIEKMDIKIIKQMPAAMGEVDIIRAMLTLPGVSSVSEASTGFNVRGGSADQNLILLNDAVVYSPSHLFGFFSSFNPDVVKDVELYKSSIPSRFGGRLASVLDIHTRDGNKKEFGASGGIGPVAGRLNLEGPINEKTSVLLSGRASYSNWLLKLLENESYNKSRASFYDLNLGVSHQVDEKNNIYLNAYASNDQFRFKYDTTYTYRNYNAGLKWTHLFGEKLFGSFGGTFSQYDYSVESDRNPVNAFVLDYKIQQSQAKADFNYFLSSSHSFDFGISTLHYQIAPGSYQPNSSESIVTPDIIESEQALESALYFSDKYSISTSLSVDIGFRYSLFNYLGPKTIAEYTAGQPKSEFSRTGETNFDKGEIVNTYKGPEFRLAARKLLPDKSSFKLSYNTGRQYIHLLSNTAAISPTDIWKLSDPNIRPQLGQQFSSGYYRNFFSGLVEASLEAYYKSSKNYLDYKSGATLIMNHNLETDVISTRGKAYGVEVMFKKTRGKLNGWISYAYSRSFLQVADPEQNETINGGNWYRSNFDKPHNFNWVGNYKFSHRFNVSLNFTYSTGRPITLPIDQYSYAGSFRVYYSDRNAYRIPDYMRADFAMNVEGNHKIKKLAHSSWTFAIYNLTGRKNPYSVYFTSTNGNIQGYKTSIFGQAIPTITYNFKF